MSELRFDGLTAAITGAGNGIGRGYALLLAKRGCAVVVNDLGCTPRGEGASIQYADEVVDEIAQGGGRAVANHASVADEAGARSIIADALSHFGRIDILINNAGIHGAAPFAAQPLAVFRQMMDVHYFGTLMTCRAAWPHMVEQGSGRILNTVSSTVFGMAEHGAYAAAKGAIFALTRALALEGEPLGIAVNSIAPGAGTRMMRDSTDVDPELIERIVVSAPPHLVAPAAAWLVHESCPLNGETLSASGGRVGRWLIGEAGEFASEALTPEVVAANASTLSSEQNFHPCSNALAQAAQRNDRSNS